MEMNVHPNLFSGYRDRISYVIIDNLVVYSILNLQNQKETTECINKSEMDK